MPNKDFCNLSSRQKRRLVLSELKSSRVKFDIHSSNMSSQTNNCIDNNLPGIQSLCSDYVVTDPDVLQCSTNHETNPLQSPVPVDEVAVVPDTFDTECITECISEEKSLSDELRSWVIEENITQAAVSRLLSILRKQGHNLPKDCRTLMKTPRTNYENEIVKNFENGQYFHYGLAKALYSTLRRALD
uniref:Uncharacterized protein n=1 Tax=Photinus pyralis TaxID=7054 RepID=A0A1Y1LS05_PHOPY